MTVRSWSNPRSGSFPYTGRQSVWTVAPDATASSMNGTRFSAVASETRLSRIRPNPFGCLMSTAIVTIASVSVLCP